MRGVVLALALGSLLGCGRPEDVTSQNTKGDSSRTTAPRAEIHRVTAVGQPGPYYVPVTVTGGRTFQVEAITARKMSVGADYRFWLADGGKVRRVDVVPPEPLDGGAPYGYPETEVVAPR